MIHMADSNKLLHRTSGNFLNNFPVWMYHSVQPALKHHAQKEGVEHSITWQPTGDAAFWLWLWFEPCFSACCWCSWRVLGQRCRASTCPHIRLRANEDHAPTPLPRFALRRSGVAAHREPGSIGHSIFGGHSEELGLRAKALDPRQSSSLWPPNIEFATVPLERCHASQAQLAIRYLEVTAKSLVWGQKLLPSNQALRYDLQILNSRPYPWRGVMQARPIGHSIFGGHSEELGLRAKALDPRQSSSLWPPNIEFATVPLERCHAS